MFLSTVVIQVVLLIVHLYAFSYLMKFEQILSLPQPNGRVLFRDYATGDLAQVDLLSYLFSKLLVYIDLIPQFQHIAVKIFIL